MKKNPFKNFYVILISILILLSMSFFIIGLIASRFSDKQSKVVKETNTLSDADVYSSLTQVSKLLFKEVDWSELYLEGSKSGWILPLNTTIDKKENISIYKIYGIIKIGIDVDKIVVEKIDDENKIIHLSCPLPSIMTNEIDYGKSEREVLKYNGRRSNLDSINIINSQIYGKGKEEIEERIEKTDILVNSKKDIERVLNTLLKTRFGNVWTFSCQFS